MNEDQTGPFLAALILKAISGGVGGMTSLTVIRGKDWRESAERLFCSAFAGAAFADGTLMLVRWKWGLIPDTPAALMFMAAMWGLFGWFVLHPFLNYFAGLKDRTPWEIAGEWCVSWLKLAGKFIPKDRKS